MADCRNCHGLTGFVFASLFSSACAAWWPSPDAVSMEIIDDHGQAFRQFDVTSTNEPSTRRAYLEAVREKRYRILVHNHTGQRIGLVLAVDGRNIISGRRSNLLHHEPMYVLDPWQSETYEGWRTGDTRVHRFFFTGADDSYAGAFGDKTAMGVIAVAAFAEKRSPRTEQQYREKSRGYGGGSVVPPAAREGAAESLSDEAAAAGTGFGEDAYSRAVRVRFVPDRRAFARQFLKYEWRDALVRMGFIGAPKPSNRFWPEFPGRASLPGYAPYPPARRW